MGFEDMGTDVGVELGWDAEIEKDNQEFILLSEGDYDFTVVDFERARYAGSEKVPPCNQAKLKLQVVTPEGIATVNHNLFLHSKYEGMISAFFCAIGQKKHGEKMQMNWGKVLGAKGKAKISIREYIKKNGEQAKSNQVKKFYDAPAPTQTVASFKPGSF